MITSAPIVSILSMASIHCLRSSAVTSQVNGWAWLKSTSLAYRVLMDGIHTMVLYLMSPDDLGDDLEALPLELDVVLRAAARRGLLLRHTLWAPMVASQISILPKNCLLMMSASDGIATTRALGKASAMTPAPK